MSPIARGWAYRCKAYRKNLQIYAQRQEKYALIDELKQDLEFIIKVKGWSVRILGDKCESDCLEGLRNYSFEVIDSRSNSNKTSRMY